MSANKPEPKDRTALYIAIVGASATIVAALIGVLPNVLKRDTPVTPIAIIITATPPPTSIAQATTIPTLTSQPTAVLGTATLQPTSAPATSTSVPPTTTPTATNLPSTPPPTALPSPTPSSIVTLLLINNLPRTMEFFIDEKSITKINSGTYQSLRVPHGKRELKQCVLGTDYNDPINCFARTYDVEPNPDVWEMFDSNNPLKTNANINLLLLNRASTPQDLIIDGQFAQTIAAGTATVITVTPGQHTLDACAVGFRPPNGACGKPVSSNYFAPTHYFIISGESS